MNKILLLLLINASLVFAGEQDGTGVPSAANASNVTHSLVCFPTNQNEENHCILIQIAEQE